jgi:hypothetical protein
MEEDITSSGSRGIEGRRNFFRNFLVCAASFVEEINGRPQMRLDELDKLPDEIVCHMVPVFNERHTCRIEGNILFEEDKKNPASLKVCDLDEIRMFIWHCIDGGNDIENIGRKIEERFGLEFDQAYEEAKSFFVFLAKRLICYPASAHEKVEGGAKG